MGYFFSLIVATLGRNDEFRSLCRSLAGQSYHNFELIVVDQNESNMIDVILDEYKTNIKIIHIKNKDKGLSLNRNIGLKYVHGDIAAFPDDDCEYKPDTLEFVNDYFLKNDCDLFTFNFEDKQTGRKHFKDRSYKISFLNFYRSGISITIFIKYSMIAKFRFDEQLGAGAQFGTGEESDMIAYLLKNKSKGFYYGYYTIYHPKGKQPNNPVRAYNNGLGFGALHKKLVFHYGKYYLLCCFVWALIKNIGAILITPKKKYYYNGLKGKIQGFMAYTIKREYQS